MAAEIEDKPTTPEMRLPQRSERARAARYLDLWERQVGHTSVHGTAPYPPVRLRGRPSPSEE